MKPGLLVLLADIVLMALFVGCCRYYTWGEPMYPWTVFVCLPGWCWLFGIGAFVCHAWLMFGPRPK